MESLRTLRLALQIGSGARAHRSILFTSAEPGVGTSTVAANYGLIASLGQNVLLIDADLRRPSLHSFFGIARTPGLVDVLRGGRAIDDVCHDIGPGMLRLLAAGTRAVHAGDVAASEDMGDLLRAAERDHDLIVLDAPPVLASSVVGGLASHPGVVVVLVVTPGSKRRTIVKALRRLALIEADVAGIVVNRAGRLSYYDGTRSRPSSRRAGGSGRRRMD